MLKYCLFFWGAIISSYSFANNPVILISIDGFANKYLSKYNPSFISSMAKQGVKSQGLLPVYPSKTFPNHLSMVTGKFPAEHGIVHNKFFHRELNSTYYLGAGKKNSRWLNAEPIWVAAERKGIKTGIYFWPESEAKVSGISPSYYYKYSHNIPNKQRLDKLIEWLKLPKSERPNLLITYFSTVDSAGHQFGTHSKQLGKAIEDIDRILVDFNHRIESETKLTPNILLVSDHGMVDIDQEKSLQVDKLLEPFPTVRTINGETQLYIYESSINTLTKVKAHLTSLEQSKFFKVYSRGEFPEHWKLTGDNPAIPDIIVEAIAPSIFLRPEPHGYGREIHKGTHGFDGYGNRDLDGIFIAKGPDIYRNQELSSFQNILVYDVIASLLKLEPKNRAIRSTKEKELITKIVKGKSE